MKKTKIEIKKNDRVNYNYKGNILPILVPNKEVGALVLAPDKDKEEDKDRDKENDKERDNENTLPILVPSKEVCVLVLSPDKGRIKPWQILRYSQIGEGPASF